MGKGKPVMDIEQLNKAKELQNRIQALSQQLKAIHEKIRPIGKQAVPMVLAAESVTLGTTIKEFVHTFDVGFVATNDPTIKRMTLPVPRVLAEKFLQEVERYYESELSAQEREFVRL